MSSREGGYSGESLFGQIRKKVGDKALPILTSLSLGFGSEACYDNSSTTVQTTPSDIKTSKIPNNELPDKIKEVDHYEEILKTASNELYRKRMGNSEAGAIRYFNKIYRNKDYRLKVRDLIKKYSKANNIPLDISYSVAATESNFDSELVSSNGAAGIFQIKPEAAKEGDLMTNKDSKKDDRFKVRENIERGNEMLGDFYKSFEDWPLALTAYSHGAAGVCRKLNKLFPELTLNKREDDFDSEGKDKYIEKLRNGELKIEKLYMYDRLFFKYALDIVAITPLALKYIEDNDVHPIKIKIKK